MIQIRKNSIEKGISQKRKDGNADEIRSTTVPKKAQEEERNQLNRNKMWSLAGGGQKMLNTAQDNTGLRQGVGCPIEETGVCK
eukprot:278976-Amorphochlora_amoeboformis.AAC.1